VRAFFPSLDLTRVGEGIPEDFSTQDLVGHIAAMDSVAERLLTNNMVKHCKATDKCKATDVLFIL
jgi:hypothetical protein